MFQSTHSLRSATRVELLNLWLILFQSTHSLRSATPLFFHKHIKAEVSIHALLAECDGGTTAMGWKKIQFQSTHSLRSATEGGYNLTAEYIVSIHALLAECDRRGRMHLPDLPVSIHALLAECDRRGGPWPEPSKSFNPRTPCGVRQRETEDDSGVEGFNPRTPCGVRQGNHLPRERVGSFQSTHSLRSATHWHQARFAFSIVSIHALLAECDPFGVVGLVKRTSFNPRTPCGVRQTCKCSVRLFQRFQSTHSLRSATEISLLTACLYIQFQSTHSLRSATSMVKAPRSCFSVSIHALLAECDWFPRRCFREPISFNPRTPCGVRPIKK